MPHCEQENFQFTDVSAANTIPHSIKSACLNRCCLAKLTTINFKSCESLIYLRSFSGSYILQDNILLWIIFLRIMYKTLNRAEY